MAECTGAPGRHTILAVHVFDEASPERIFKRVAPLLRLADQVWCSSSDARLLARTQAQLSDGKQACRTFLVDNRWHDWSGYLAFLGAQRAGQRLICCNDSLLTRRVVTRVSMRAFVRAMAPAQALLSGELDTARCSLELDGWSSACWISTYLFAAQGFTIDSAGLEASVERQVAAILAARSHPLLAFLSRYRPTILESESQTRAKLGAMLLERWLTRAATQSGAMIVDAYAGSLVRKVERKLERLRDG